MVTLIAVYTRRGCVGRCDAKCYEAITPHCDCICGGANHRVGLTQATENTRERVEEWIEEYAERKNLNQYKAKLNRTVVDQFTLFDISKFSRAIQRRQIKQ